MKLGNNIFFLITLIFFYHSTTFSEDKIITTPLINLEELKPSFEEIDNIVDEPVADDSIKNKKNIKMSSLGRQRHR